MKAIKYSRNKALTILYICVIVIGTAKVYMNETSQVSSMPINHKTVAIDAGHGGFDPGKVAGDGTEEKGINLKIAQKLQSFLEQGGAIVVNTRVTDEALGNTKRDDLKNRVELAKVNNADLLVSIHQNSFPKNSVKGAQVFYNKSSQDGKKLAGCIQKRMREVVDNNNDRVEKDNTNYYLLKKVNIPSVIVECGFLSNTVEKEKLISDEYQEKLAWAIYMRILDYYSIDIA